MRAVLIVSLAAALTAGPALAQNSVAHVSAAGAASGAAVANLAAAGVQAVAGVVALPVGVVGGASQLAGGVIGAGGDSLAAAGTGATDAAGQAIDQSWGALKVDERVVVKADPAPKVPYAAQKPAR
jgi:hypothetical protein